MTRADRQGGRRLVHLFTGTIADQAMLSAVNFLVGLLVLRHSSDEDYGMFVLVTSTLLLVSGVQGALIAAPISVMSPKMSPEDRSSLLATLLPRQYFIWVPCIAIAACGFALAGAIGFLPWSSVLVGAFGCVTACAYLGRDYLREVLLIRSAPYVLLSVDAIFAVVQLVLIAGAAFLCDPKTPYATLALGLAALVSSIAAYRMIGRRFGWSARSYPHPIRETWRLGKWGLMGCIIYWLNAQGIYYLLAGMEGTQTVAGVAMARLLLMPINLMQSGVSMLLLPMAAGWLHHEGRGFLVRRLTLITGLVLAASVLYFGIVWIPRDWIVTVILRRDVGALDSYMLVWGGVFLVMIMRATFMTVVQAEERFAEMAVLNAVAAAIALGTAWYVIRHDSPLGSVWGMLVSEVVNLAGVAAMIAFPRRPKHGGDVSRAVAVGTETSRQDL